MKKYRILLLVIVAIVWIWAAINPKFPHDWLIENYLVFIFIPLIIAAGRYFQLSNFSYTLVTIFMCLHIVGSHYTYAEVPFGYVLQDWVGADRNMYDRLVHFSFGFLLAYPMREIFLRLARVKGFWGYYLPLDVTLSFSALYEVIEWITAANVDPAAGLAFLGSQGDIWDAQKDMLMAGTGAIIAMLGIAYINWRLNENFGKEMRDSFRIEKRDSELGEVWLERMLRRSKNKA